MLNKLLAAVRRYEMVQPGDRVICAVSGGADSVALLFALYLLKDKLGICLEAAHFNHQLRGGESDRDERFVRELCSRYDITLHVGVGTVTAGRKGLEAAARDARYGFLQTLHGKIATAHTADDNAETVLMHMVRGTGLKGLGAIAPVRGNVIRPMLLVTRQQVLDFLREYHLSYVEDSSNETDAFLRNRLRHHVMPLLRQENPRLAESLSAMALRLREDEAALYQDTDFSDGLQVCALLRMPKARQSRVIGAFLEHCSVKEPSAEHIALALALARSENPSAQAAFPGGVTVCREYGVLVKRCAEKALADSPLSCPGSLELPELGLRVLCTEAKEIINSGDTFTVSSVDNMVLRCRRAGDSMRLRAGTKPLKKLFIDRKLPAHQRLRIPVIADEKGVLGVYGIGVNLDRAAQSLPAVQIRFIDSSNVL